MPSIQDVADQINAKLDTVATNTGNTTANTAIIKAEIAQTNQTLVNMDGHFQAGFANLSQGLLVAIEIEAAIYHVLDHMREQNDTIICLLENADEMLCGITRKLSAQLLLSQRLVRSSERIEAIVERVHAAEAADFDRQVALKAQIEECCPPEEPPLEPCPPACPRKDYRPLPVPQITWKPLETPPPPKQPNQATRK
jgi:hypothetical protein